jgi:hypothetical protein
MSLCFALMSRNFLVMAGDSRESISINGEHYATGNYVPKLQQIGDKVIFRGGSAEVTTSILSEFSAADDQSVERLQELTIKHKDKFIQEHGVDYLGKTAHAIFMVGYVENGIPVLCGINTKNDCKIEKHYAGGAIETAIVGPSGTKDIAYTRYLEYRKRGTDIIEMLQYVYDSVANEEIGGQMTVYTFSNGTINCEVYHIKDSKNIRIADIRNLHYNSDTMEWRVHDEQRLYFDAAKGNIFFAGDLEAAGGTFRGTLQAVDGIFTGTLQAADGTFTGTLQGVDGTFSGTISASTITGGQISGTFINGATVTGSTISTRVGNGRGIVLNSGWADLEIYSGVNSANVTFAIRDLLGDTSVVFERNGDVSAINGDLSLRAERIFINAPGGVYVNGVQIG